MHRLQNEVDRLREAAVSRPAPKTGDRNPDEMIARLAREDPGFAEELGKLRGAQAL
jgi:hypothetical protein